MDCTNDDAVEAFLRKTRYYPEPLDKAQLLQAYETNRPRVVAVTPASRDGLLEASVTEIRVEFSRAMGPTTQTEPGPAGPAEWPVTGRTGFSADKKSYTYKVALKPGQAYHFIVTGNIAGGGFRSADGYPLQSYEVKFRTKP